MIGSPLAIGGVGGSGTRLIAELVAQLGFYLGDDLNDSSDNLWFTLLFKRVELATADARELLPAVEVFRAAMTGDAPLAAGLRAWVESLAACDRPQHAANWLHLRVQSVLAATAGPVGHDGRPWGWKEPNTHVFLDRLPVVLPGMRYVHVLRNGLDMAYSDNQNQLQLWGRHFFGHADYQLTPRWALKYWRLTNQRVEEIGQRMGSRCLLIDYDALCRAPREGVARLCRFLGLDPDPEAMATLVARVRPPNTIGRFRRHGLQPFDREDVDYVASLGFDTAG